MGSVFAASYWYNMNGVGLWIVAVALSLYAIGSWIYRHARGESPAPFQAYPRKFLKFIHDEDVEPKARPPLNS